MQGRQVVRTIRRRAYAWLVALAALSACAGPLGEARSPGPATLTEPPAAATPAAQDGATAAPAGEPGERSPVAIGFAAPEPERQAYEPLIAEFNRQNPDVRVQFVPRDEPISQSFDQMMRQIVSSADTAATFLLRPEDIASGLVRDLKPLIDADASFDAGDFYPGALAPESAGGGIYLLPRTLRPALFSYNKDLWARRGLPAPPTDWTWRDLLAAAEQLAQKRGDAVDIYGLAEGSNGLEPLAGLLAEAGVDLAADAAQIRLDRPEIAAAIERMAGLAASGAVYVSPESSDSNQPHALLKLIADQRVAMWFGAPVVVGPDAPASKLAVGSAPLPERGAPDRGGAEGYIMSSGTQHPDEAWRWLSFLSRQEVRQPFFDTGEVQFVPARKSLAERGGYWRRLDPDAAAAVQAALARGSSPLANFSVDRRAAAALGQALAAVVNDGRPVAQALAAAQASLDRQVAEALATPSPTPNAAPIVVATPASNAPAPGATTIAFDAPLFQAEQFRRLAEEFNRQHPELFVDVKASRLDPDLSLAQMAANADCFSWPESPAAGPISATLDLQPLADADPSFELGDYPPALLAPFKRGDALYGLPYQLRLRALTYNQSAFDTAGLAYPSASWTADDFLNAARQLTSDSEKDKRYGYASLGSQTDDLLLFLNLLGASITRGGEPNLDDPAVERAARFYVDMLRGYSPHKQIQGYARSLSFGGEPFELIEAGRVGMWFELPEGIRIVRIGPDQPERPAYTRAIAPPPGADKVGPDGFGASGLYISARSQQARACWQWLQFLSGDLSALGSNFPARRSLALSGAFQQGALPGAAEVYAAYLPALDRVPAAQRASGESDSARIDPFWFFRAVDRALQGQDLGRELDRAQDWTTQYLACVRAGGAAGTCARQVDPSYDGFAGAEGRE